MKRIFDLTLSCIGLLILSPILLIFVVLIWLQDFRSPFYVAPRMSGRDKRFKMIKLRSMVVGADKKGGNSTSTNDRRVTWVGKFIRRYKLDEFSQLWNVFLGDMSLVGPRPQVERDVMLYTEEEYRLFDSRPGITDFSSIVFSDEGEILKEAVNPDLHYNQYIRPWKSRLGILYSKNNSVGMDLRIIILTIISIFSRRIALDGVSKILKEIGADQQIIDVASRKHKLIAYPPPGANQIEVRW